MKRCALFLIFLTGLYGLAWAEEAYFELSTMTLVIPCVTLVPGDGAQTCYPVTLQYEQRGGFSIKAVGTPIARVGSEYDAAFDLQDLVLSIPAVSVAGSLYEVQLVLNPQTSSFALTSIRQKDTVQPGPNNPEYKLVGSCGNNLFGICADFYTTDSAPDVVSRAQDECKNQLGTWSSEPCEQNFIKKCQLVKNETYQVTSYLYDQQSVSFFDGLCAIDMSQVGSMAR